jgi:hypothetical protein
MDEWMVGGWMLKLFCGLLTAIKIERNTTRIE